MELLIAMFAGAIGGVLVRGVGRWVGTALGILGGVGGWYLLGLLGPGLRAGPLTVGHVLAGALGGAVLAFVAALAWRRAGG